VYDTTASKVPEAVARQPAFFCPAPMRWNGVNQPCHDYAEEQVTMEVASLCNCARHDCGGGGRKSALQIIYIVLYNLKRGNYLKTPT
jgi:hypothetical protein